jgi:hypothetical protein
VKHYKDKHGTWWYSSALHRSESLTVHSNHLNSTVEEQLVLDRWKARTPQLFGLRGKFQSPSQELLNVKYWRGLQECVCAHMQNEHICDIPCTLSDSYFCFWRKDTPFSFVKRWEWYAKPGNNLCNWRITVSLPVQQTCTYFTINFKYDKHVFCKAFPTSMNKITHCW